MPLDPNPLYLDGIAMACLAVNLAYLALEKFRYRGAIKCGFEEARKTIDPMPDAMKSDLAWKFIADIPKATNYRAWTNPLSYSIYKGLFEFPSDRILTGVFSFVAVTSLIAAACATLIGRNPSFFTERWIWFSFGVMSAGVVTPAVFIWLGRHCQKVAIRSIKANFKHLAERYRDEYKGRLE